MKNAIYIVLPVKSWERRWHRLTAWFDIFIKERKLPEGTYFIHGRALTSSKIGYLYQRPVYKFIVMNGSGVYEKKLPRTFRKQYYCPKRGYKTKKKPSRDYALLHYVDPY